VKLLALILKSLLFYFMGITLWVGGTLFHGFLWWSLGIPELPAFLPFMNLAFLPFAFWLSFQLTLHPNGLNCIRCRTAVVERRERPATIVRKPRAELTG